jgi:hypothetical protein
MLRRVVNSILSPYLVYTGYHPSEYLLQIQALIPSNESGSLEAPSYM